MNKLLKKGDKGPEVVRLQKILNVIPDGKFGPQTEKAVMRFQLEKQLVVDGIVGNNTWHMLSLSKSDGEAIDEDSDIMSQHFETQYDQLIHRYYLDKNEYLQRKGKNEYCFLHHTAGRENPYRVIDHWNKDTRGRVATEFVIGGQSHKGTPPEYDGVVVQAFPEGGYGWHLGIGNNIMHRASVGIEVNNFGFLTEGGYYKRVNGIKTWIKKTPDKFYTYVGTEALDSQVVELDEPFRGFKHWHRYSDKQIAELKKLLLFIADRDNIDVRKGLPQLIKEKGVEAFNTCSVSMCQDTKGLWTHTNCRTTKVDMFPQEELIEMLLSL